MVGQIFDYEIRSFFIVLFIVIDIMVIMGFIDFIVNINNINEVCYFDKMYYYVMFVEVMVGIEIYCCFFLVFELIIQRVDKERFIKLI